MRIKVKKTGQVISTPGSGYKNGDVIRVQPSGSDNQPKQIKGAVIADPYKLRVTGTVNFLGKTIQVGYNGLIRVSDGTDWVHQRKTTRNHTSAFVVDDKCYVGCSDGTILVSADLSTWDVCGVLPSSVVSITSQGVTTSSGAVYNLNGDEWVVTSTVASTDYETTFDEIGSEVTNTNTTVSDLTSVVIFKDIQYAIDTQGNVVMSYDGDNWFVRFATSTIKAFATNGDKLVGVTTDNKVKLFDGSTWGAGITLSGINTINGVSYSDGVFLVYGDNDSVLTSPDAVTWTKLTDDYEVRDIVSNPEGTVFLGLLADRKLVRSTDGLNWYRVLDPIVKNSYHIAFFAGKFVVAGGEVLSASVDGITFIERPVGVEDDIVALAAGSSKLLVIAGNKAVSTPDLNVFTSVTLEVSPDKASFSAGYFAAFTETNSRLFYSDDCLTWYETVFANSGVDESIYSVTLHKGVVYFTTYNAVYKVVDGINERVLSTPSTQHANNFKIFSTGNKLIWSNGFDLFRLDEFENKWVRVLPGVGQIAKLKEANGKFFAFAINTNSPVNLIMSDDGISWNHVTTPGGFTDVSFFNGAYYFVGYETQNNVIYRTTDFSIFDQVYCPRDTCYSSATNGSVFVMTSGSSWFVTSNMATWDEIQIPNMPSTTAETASVISNVGSLFTDGESVFNAVTKEYELKSTFKNAKPSLITGAFRARATLRIGDEVFAYCDNGVIKKVIGDITDADRPVDLIKVVGNTETGEFAGICSGYYEVVGNNIATLTVKRNYRFYVVNGPYYESKTAPYDVIEYKQGFLVLHAGRVYGLNNSAYLSSQDFVVFGDNVTGIPAAMRSAGAYTTIQYFRDINLFMAGTSNGKVVVIPGYYPFIDGQPHSERVVKIIRTGGSIFCIYENDLKRRDNSSPYTPGYTPLYPGDNNNASWFLNSFRRAAFEDSPIVKMSKLGVTYMGVNASGNVVMYTDQNVWMNPSIPTNKVNDVVSTHNKFVLVGDSGSVMTATDYNNFAMSLVTQNNLNAVTSNGDVVVACGDKATIIKSSDGGHSWEDVMGGEVRMFERAQAKFNLSAICVSGDAIAVVGKDSTIASLYVYSNWFNVFKINKEQLDFVLPIGNRFIAYSGANYALASADCLTWFRDVTFTHPGYKVSSFGWSSILPQKVVGIGAKEQGATNPTIISTADGISWVRRANPARHNLNKVVAGPSGYVAVGDSATILFSATGENWAAATSDNVFTDIVFNEQFKKYVTVGAGGYAGYKAVPQTGETNWEYGFATGITEKDYNFKSMISVGDVVMATADGGRVMYTNDGVYWGVTATDSTVSLNACAVAQVGGRKLYVVVGDSGKVMTSPDCKIFTSRASGFNTNLRSIVHDGYKFVAVGDGGRIYTSQNTSTWVSKTSTSTANLNKIVKFNSRFVVVGAGGLILTSDDSTTWVKRTSGVTQNIRSIAIVGGFLIAVGDGGVVLKSTDGVTWDKLDIGIVDNLTHIIHAVEANDTQTTVITHIFGSGGYHLKSFDLGVTWVTGSANYTHVEFTDEYRVAKAESGYGDLIASSNGTNWYISNGYYSIKPAMMVVGNVMVRYEGSNAFKYEYERGLTGKVTSVDASGGVVGLELYPEYSSVRLKGLLSEDESYAASSPIDMAVTTSNQTNRYEGRVRKVNLSARTISTLPSSSNPIYGQIGNHVQSENTFTLVRVRKDSVTGTPFTPGELLSAKLSYFGGELGDVICFDETKTTASTKYEIRDASGVVALSVDADYGEINQLYAGTFVAMFVSHAGATSTLKFFFKTGSAGWVSTSTKTVSGFVSASLQEGICLLTTSVGLFAFFVGQTVDAFPEENVPLYNSGAFLPYSRGGKNYLVRPCLAGFGQYAKVALFQGAYAVMMTEVFESTNGQPNVNGNKNIGAMPFVFDLMNGTCEPTYDLFSTLGLTGGTFTKYATKDGASFYNNQPRFYSFAANSSMLVAASKVKGKENLVDVYTFEYSSSDNNLFTVNINRVDTGVESFYSICVPGGASAKYAIRTTTPLGNGSVSVFNAITGSNTYTSPGGNKDYGKSIAFDAAGDYLYIGDPMANIATSGSGGIANFTWSIKELNPSFRGEQINSITLSFTEGGVITPCPPITMAGVGNVGAVTKYWPMYTSGGGGVYTRPSQIKVTVDSIT